MLFIQFDLSHSLSLSVCLSLSLSLSHEDIQTSRVFLRNQSSNNKRMKGKRVLRSVGSLSVSLCLCLSLSLNYRDIQTSIADNTSK